MSTSGDQQELRTEVTELQTENKSAPLSKGKGKAQEESAGDVSMESVEDDDESGSEVDDDEAEARMEAEMRDPENEDAEDYAEIDPSNILPPGTRRTRTAAKAPQEETENKEADVSMDDEEDTDFKADEE
ncbi:hypothetical protein BT69DRAFT_1345729 [Atractiella rhizophila]|nr:hypothetical protein BT69DRAFT_1345729 [Atractiella rhizophila]